MRAVSIIAGLALVMAGYFNLPTNYATEIPGFFHGVFQGVVSPLTLVFGWIWNVRIYTSPNAGWLYDLGWMTGLLAFFGAASFAVKQ